MGVNKVVFGAAAIMDISDSTVTPDKLAKGVTAYDKSGEKITGTMKGGGGVSVQADWNQTDETAADFIKNKPFGSTETLFVEEQSYVSNDADGAELNANEVPAIGANVIVIHDNATYECTVFGFQGFPALGNTVFVGGDDTGEPFFAFWGPGVFLVIDMDNGVDHTFQCVGESIEKIPEKYYERGAVVFYTTFPLTGDARLYADLEEGTIATKADLERAIHKPVQISFLDVWLCSPIFITVHPDNVYGSVAIFLPQTEQVTYLYTVEAPLEN